MAESNGFFYTEPKRKYFKEYLSACREAIENNDTEWAPVKPEDLGRFRFYAPKMYKRMKSGKGLPENYPVTFTYWCFKNNTFVGECQIRPYIKGDAEKNIGHIGYSVRPSLRGKGYGQMLLGFAVRKLSEFNVYPIFAVCHKENTVSYHCLSKAGFRRAGDHPDDAGKPSYVYELRYEKDGDIIHPCEISCGAVVYTVVDGNIRYALIRSLTGDQGFPKGHTEGDETESQTALREIKEEIGVDAKLLDGFYEQTAFYLPRKRNVLKRVTYFLAYYENQKLVPQQAEIAEVRLMDYESALSVLRHEDSKSLLYKANEYITENMQ